MDTSRILLRDDYFVRIIYEKLTYLDGYFTNMNNPERGCFVEF